MVGPEGFHATHEVPTELAGSDDLGDYAINPAAPRDLLMQQIAGRTLRETPGVVDTAIAANELNTEVSPRKEGELS